MKSYITGFQMPKIEQDCGFSPCSPAEVKFLFSLCAFAMFLLDSWFYMPYMNGEKERKQ